MSSTRPLRSGTGGATAWEIDPASEVVSLLGSQEGLAHIALSVVNEGDTVLVPDPCYRVFGDGPGDCGGAAVFYAPSEREELSD